MSSWATSVINADTLGITFGDGANVALLGFGDDLTLAAIVESGIDSAITAGLSSVVYGTDFGAGFLSSFGNSLATLATADFQTLIGDQGLKEGGFAHAGLHGLVGCISAAATGADCAAGALGGVVQSVYAGTLEGKGPDPADYATKEDYDAAYGAWRDKVGTTANLIGGAVGYVFSGGSAANVSATASIAQSGILNNYLSHTEIAEFIQEMEECGFEDRDCREAVKAKYHDISEINLAEMQACRTKECWDMHAERIREAQSAVNDLYNSAFPQDAVMNVVNIDLSNFVNAEQRGSGQSFWLQNNAAEVFGAWGAENCGGLMDQACMMSFTQSRLHDSFMAAAEMGIDFLPIIGDAKGFAECGVELSLGSCLGAVAGLIPLLGDGAKILLKRGDDVIEVVADGAGGVRVLDDAAGAGHYTPSQPLDAIGNPIVRTNDRSGVLVQPNGPNWPEAAYLAS